MRKEILQACGLSGNYPPNILRFAHFPFLSEPDKYFFLLFGKPDLYDGGLQSGHCDGNIHGNTVKVKDINDRKK